MFFLVPQEQSKHIKTNLLEFIHPDSNASFIIGDWHSKIFCRFYFLNLLSLFCLSRHHRMTVKLSLPGDTLKMDSFHFSKRSCCDIWPSLFVIVAVWFRLSWVPLHILSELQLPCDRDDASSFLCWHSICIAKLSLDATGL